MVSTPIGIESSLFRSKRKKYKIWNATKRKEVSIIIFLAPLLIILYQIMNVKKEYSKKVKTVS